MKSDTVTQRYARMARKLGIDSSLKNLRAYNATELISAGVDPRTVAGRLGHGGGGATTLKVYTAWSSEADQRAAGVITTRMPPRPGGGTAPERANQMAALPGPVDADVQLYQQIAADLRGAIDSGVLMPGEPLPSEKTLAGRYGVAPSTAHRAIAVLVASGLVIASRGVRATVALGTHPEPGDHTSAVVKLRP